MPGADYKARHNPEPEILRKLSAAPIEDDRLSRIEKKLDDLCVRLAPDNSAIITDRALVQRMIEQLEHAKRSRP